LEVRLHPDVRSYLDELEDSDQDRCEESLKKLSDEPFRSRPKCDIKKLKGRDKTMYRLRVGNHRFEYFVEENKVWIAEAFKRGRGYR